MEQSPQARWWPEQKIAFRSNLPSLFEKFCPPMYVYGKPNEDDMPALVVGDARKPSTPILASDSWLQ